MWMNSSSPAPDEKKLAGGGQGPGSPAPPPDANDPTQGTDSLSKALRRNLTPRRLGGLFSRMLSTLRTRGFEAAAREVGFRWRLATHGEVWRYRADIPLRKELRAQRRESFPYMPQISIVVPMYNTDPGQFSQLLQSVRRQSYQNWELVLVDASDLPAGKAGGISAPSAGTVRSGKPKAAAQSTPAGALAAKAAEADPRIRYTRLRGNNGIAANTNIGLAESEGEWITLLDHDDVLQPNALYEVVRAVNSSRQAETANPEDAGFADLVYSDEIVLDATLQHLGEYHFKPDYGPDTLRGCNYITHLCAFSRRLLDAVGGGERTEFDGAQDYDLILRLSEKARGILHIPKVLYFWRRHAASTASGIQQKPEALAAGAAALQDHLARVRLEGRAEPQLDHPGSYRIRYSVWGRPQVSVLIPSKDHTDDLARCLASLYAHAGWDNFEVLVLDNNSTDHATEAYYAEAEETWPNLQVLRWPQPRAAAGFNFAAVCNFGAARAKGDHLLLLNNDIEVLGDNFLREMLSYSQRPDVGAVGPMLYYEDDTVQHAGLIMGIGGTAGVSHKGHQRGNGGDLFRLATTQNMSAVTGAALMVKRSLYNALGGMDEQNFAVAFNDVDFCLRLRAQGLWNVFTPFAEAYHYESKSRGYDTEGPNKERYDREAAAFRQRHADILEQGDPFYNPHFTLKTENFALK